MTTRQFLSILFSCLWFVHPLTGQQWVGTILVFGALYYSSFASKPKSHGHGSSGKAKPTELGDAEELGSSVKK